jgi:predicted secreted hydrolase
VSAPGRPKRERPCRPRRCETQRLRRMFLASPLLLVAGAARAVDYPRVIPGTGFTFPRDHGSHSAFRTEWWYVTGWVKDGSGNEFGIQVTFFRHRPGIAEDNPSAFAPRQLLFAHAALADSRHGRLRHDQRSARAGFALAEAREETTNVRIGDWSLTQAEDAFVTRIAAREFALDLRFVLTQALLPEGDGGFSRKGSDPRQASYYYSCPQLAVSGDLTVDGRTAAVAGTAWLDHEWSSEYMASDAVGWDWTGINLADGGALMAFQMRGRDGRPLWAGGTHRDANGQTRTFTRDEIRFVPQRRWRSPRTEVDFPVAMVVSAGGVEYTLAPLVDDQELDSRSSTGTIYWEGAVRAQQGGREVGKGYLELTGYWKPLQM